MSYKPESRKRKTRIENLEGHLLQERSTKSKPASMQSCRIQVKLNQPLFEKDFLSQLPKEIAYRIIAYLTPRDLMSCARVSRTWQRLCEDDRTWQRICLENGYVELDAPSFRFLGGWAANRTNQAGITIFSHMNLEEAQQNRREREVAYGQCYGRSPWKSLYLRRKRITSNWRSRAIQSSTVLKGHNRDENVMTCLQIYSDRIFTCYGKRTARVWNVDDAQLNFTLTGLGSGVRNCQVSDDGKYIVSLSDLSELSEVSEVRVWCGQTGVQRHVLRGHMDIVFCFSLHGNTLVTGSQDGTLRVWDIVDGKCLHIWAGHSEAVSRVLFDGERAVSNGFTLKVWNVHTEECLHTLTGHTDRVSSLLFEPGRDLVVSGSLDATIRVWNVRRGTCIAHLVGYQRAEVGRDRFRMELRGNILVSCYGYTDVRVWNIRDGGSCIHRLKGASSHLSSAIGSMRLLDSGLLVTGSLNGWVKLWDVNKGKFVRDLVRFQSVSTTVSMGSIWHLEATETLLVCAVGSRDADKEKLIWIDFDTSYP